MRRSFSALPLTILKHFVRLDNKVHDTSVLILNSISQSPHPLDSDWYPPSLFLLFSLVLSSLIALVPSPALFFRITGLHTPLGSYSPIHPPSLPPFDLPAWRVREQRAEQVARQGLSDRAVLVRCLPQRLREHWDIEEVREMPLLVREGQIQFTILSHWFTIWLTCLIRIMRSCD